MAEDPTLQQQVQAGTPGGLRRAVGTSLIEAGFQNLGGAMAKAFDDPGARVGMARMGENIRVALYDQWWKQEAENFRASAGEKLTQTIQAAEAEYNNATAIMPMAPGSQDPGVEAQAAAVGSDPLMPPPAAKSGYMGQIALDSPEAITHYEQQTKKFYRTMNSAVTQYLDEAGQFANNPYIGQSAQQVVQSIAGVFEAQRQASQDAQRMQANQRASEQHEVAMERAAREAAEAERAAEVNEARDIQAVTAFGAALERGDPLAEQFNPGQEYSPDSPEFRRAGIAFMAEQQRLSSLEKAASSKRSLVEPWVGASGDPTSVQTWLNSGGRGGELLESTILSEVTKAGSEALTAWNRLSDEEKQAHMEEFNLTWSPDTAQGMEAETRKATAVFNAVGERRAMIDAIRSDVGLQSRLGVSAADAEEWVFRNFPELWQVRTTQAGIFDSYEQRMMEQDNMRLREKFGMALPKPEPGLQPTPEEEEALTEPTPEEAEATFAEVQTSVREARAQIAAIDSILDTREMTDDERTVLMTTRASLQEVVDGAFTFRNAMKGLFGDELPPTPTEQIHGLVGLDKANVNERAFAQMRAMGGFLRDYTPVLFMARNVLGAYEKAGEFAGIAGEGLGRLAIDSEVSDEEVQQAVQKVLSEIE